jgi:hypothetical protein
MVARAPDPSGLLSVAQFAARERVSRARVLQLLAAGRIAGAQRIGHLWAIPTAAAIERGAPGRPRRRRAEPARKLLREMARKYVWWRRPAEAAADPGLAITQVMELGDYDDVLRLEAAFGRPRLARALREAAPGRFSPRAWTYWHYRLGLVRGGKVPPLPQRKLA